MLNSLPKLTLSHSRTGQLSWSVRGQWTRAVPGWEGEADLHCGVQCCLCVPMVDGGAVHTLTCWVKCGRDTRILVSSSGGKSPYHAARAGIVRAVGITAVWNQVVYVSSWDVSSVMASFQLLFKHTCGFNHIMVENHSKLWPGLVLWLKSVIIKESDLVC